MPVSVTGGSLEFVATLNTDDFLKGQKDIEVSIQRTAQTAIEASKQQQAAMVSAFSPQNISSAAIDSVIAKIKTLQEEEEKLKQIIASTNDQQALTGFKASLDEVSAKLDAAPAELYKTVLEEVAKQMVNTSESVSKSFDNTSDAVKQTTLIIAEEAKKQRVFMQSAFDTGGVEKLNEYLSSIGTEGSENLSGLIARYKELTTQIKNFQTQLSQTKDPVALKTINSGIDQNKTFLQDLTNKIRAEIAKDPIEIPISIQQDDPEEIEKVVSTLTRLRQLKSELATADPSSPQFSAMLAEATELEERVKGVNTELALSSSNVGGVQALQEGVRGLAGGFQAFQGILALTSDSSEEVKEATQKVIAVMGILNGITEVGAVLEKNSALNTFLLAQYRNLSAINTGKQAVATGALVVAETAEIVATEGATVAQYGLNTAMSLNPAAILLIALAAIVAAYQLYAANVKDATEEQIKMNDALAKANAILIELTNSAGQNFKDNTKAAQDAVSLAQAQGKSEKEVAALREKALQAKRQENVFTLASLGYTAKELEYGKFQLENLNLQIHSKYALVAAGGELNEVDQKGLELLEKQKKALESTLNPAIAASDAIKAADTETANLRAEAAKKGHEDALASSKAEADARLINAEKNSKEELAAKIADIRTAARVELDNVNLTAGERKKILAQERRDIEEANRAFHVLELNNDKSAINARLAQVEEGTASELQLKIDLLNKTAEIERQQEGISAERRKEIRNKLEKDVSDITRVFAFKNQEENLQGIIAGIGQRLATVEQGSEQELKLRKELIDKKASLDIVSAQSQIKNQILLVAKIKEINGKARADEKKADDEYYDRKLKEQITQINTANEFAKLPLQKIINDPTSTPTDKYNAQRQEHQNDLNTIQSQINLTGNNIIKSRGDVVALKTQLDALALKKGQLQNGIDLLDETTRLNRIKEFVGYISFAADGFNKLADAVAPFNKGLSDALKQMSSISSISGDVFKAITSYETGDYLGAASSGISAITSILKIFSTTKESAAKAKADIQSFNDAASKGEFDINILYRERLRTQKDINDLALEGIVKRRIELAKERTDSANDYNKILAQIQKQSFISGQHTQTQRSIIGGLVGFFTGVGSTTSVVNDFSSLAGKNYDDLEKLFLSDKLDEKAKALFEQLKKLKQEGIDIDAALEENKRKAAEVFTGTTADSITDMIVDGFANGFKSVQDFAGKTEDIIRKALLNALRYQGLEAPIKKLYEQFAIDAQSGGGLDLSEINSFNEGIKNAIETAQKMAEQLEKASGISLSATSAATSSNSLTGALKTITEETGGIIAGNIGGLRLTAIAALNIAQSSLNTLNKIENNTSMIRDTNDYLRKFDTQGIRIRA